VLDFTSALYLGPRHPSQSLRPWPTLTTGKPAALEPPPDAGTVAQELAALQGCERATLLPSTLHLFWDLFGVLARDRVRIYMDAGSYAIARWGVERAAARQIPVHSFPHHDAEAVRDLIERDRAGDGRPIIVTDGFCPKCGRPAPIRRYLDCVERRRGYLVLDDTQALGILGAKPTAAAPYGHGGGGSLQHGGISSPRVVVGSSLAKGFGVPIAVLAGNARLMEHFEEQSETRVHSSPPAIALIRAGERALAVSREQGDSWRRYLLTLVRRFRAGLRRIGVAAGRGLFPVVTIKPTEAANADTLHRRLLRVGIRTVVIQDCGGINARVAFLITVLHAPSDIDRAVEAIGRAMTFDRVVDAPLARVS
jgi:8-amino-7-oxononanoate synthase